MHNLGVIGGGAWGSAIANLLANNGHKVKIWAKEEETVNNINLHQENKIFLPGIKLHANISASNQYEILETSEAIFLVSPVQFIADIIKEISKKNIITNKTPIIICAKGIELKTNRLLSKVLEEIIPNNPILTLSGPNFADEIASLTPAITTVAAKDKTIADQIAKYLKNENFKVYIHDDIIGVELAGALKNVIAIATGIATGLELPISSISAILTKGIHEMALISEALGGRRDTMLEACGIGDLTLTCLSEKSRNMSLGIEIGKGNKLNDILNKRKTVAEGALTCKAVYDIINKYHLNCHIFSLTYEILYADLDPSKARFI